MSDTDEPRVTFAHEIAVRQSDTRIDNSVHLAPRRKSRSRVEPATKWDALSYKEPIASDVEPILFPWGGVRSQTGAGRDASSPRPRRSPSGSTSRRGPEAGGTTRSPPPSPGRAADTEGRARGRASRRAARAVPKDRGVVRATSRQGRPQGAAWRATAAPSAWSCSAATSWCSGRASRAGRATVYVTLAQFADAADIKELSARDLTGDGAADLVVRGVRHVSADNGPTSFGGACSSTR